MKKTMSFFKINNPFRRFLAAAVCIAVLFSAFPFFCVKADYGYDLPWLWPVPGSFKINCLDYYFCGEIHNQGQCMDIGANGYTGENRLDIVSATSGRVFYIQNKYNETSNRGSGWGNYVIVQSGNINIVYGHLKSVSCSYGEIKAGDIIGKMGNTGNSTGVHLHLQAYPADEKLTSTAIPVFERFRTNPLYREKFQFMRGLKDESVRYGAWIAEYYKTLSCSYYIYSGGFEPGFDTVPVSAKVSCVNTSGAPVRSLPLSDNSYIVSTISNGKKVSISGYYYDAYGEIWLKLSDGSGWVEAADVGFYDYIFSVSLKDAVYPDREYGSFREMPLGGILESQNIIESYTAEIRSGSTVLASYTEKAGTGHVILENVFDKMEISELRDGKYTFVLSAKEAASYPGVDTAFNIQELVSSDFTINEELSDKIPPVLEKFEITSVTPDEIILYCTTSDNKQVSRVTVSAAAPDGRVIKTYECSAADGKYTLKVNTSDLEGEGIYTFTASVYDEFRNSDSESRTVPVPGRKNSEVWKAVYALKVRSGPGTKYGHIDGIKKGASFTVTEMQAADGYVWGRHSKGWSPVINIGVEPFATYVSGHLYTVMFDLNGGTGSTPAPIEKRFGTDCTIVCEEVPVREGYTFLGWAGSTDAEAPEYKTGDTYSMNASAVLFAVWEDKEPPVISSVSVSDTKWTNSNVKLTVDASDNTGKLYFSFDGGSSWCSSGIFEIRENTVLPAGTVVVKDRAGNVAVFNEEIKIENIDKIPPTVTDSSVGISVSGENVIFNFTDITDDGSGVLRYEIIYSLNKNMESPVITEIESGRPVPFTPGVYYWRLSVTDNAGNKAEHDFPRFRVGDPERLSAPDSVRVVKTSSDSTVLSWDAVSNADYYKIGISLSETFENEISGSTSGTGYTITGLTAGKTYYFRVSSLSDDGIYLPSDWSAAGSFITLSNDTSLYGFYSMTDAVIDTGLMTVNYTAPYSAAFIDLRPKIHSKASAAYYADSGLTQQISVISAYPFSSQNAVIYLKVTAENGDTSVYTVNISRAAEKAALPKIEYVFSNEEIYAGDRASELAISAVSPDGGEITYEWYMSYEGGEPVKIGTESSVLPNCQKAGVYSIYAVVKNTNYKCSIHVTSVSTDRVTVTVLRRVSPISVSCSSFVYNWHTPVPQVSDYIGDGPVTFRYFSDADCRDEISAPSDAGTYYVKACAVRTYMYEAAESEAVLFRIDKAENSSELDFSVVQPSLRDPVGHITVRSEGAEYRVGGSDLWKDAGNTPLDFSGGCTVELRYKETANHKAGKTFTVEIREFAGASDITPNESSGMYVKGQYLFVTGSRVTADEILKGLEKSGGVNIYSPAGELLNKKPDYTGTGAVIKVEDDLGVYMQLTVIVLGDMDGDGAVTEADAMMIMHISNGMHISESIYDLPAGDIDGDGIITSKDAYLALIKT